MKHLTLTLLSSAALAGTAFAQTPTPGNADQRDRTPSTAPDSTSPGNNTTTNSTTLRTATAQNPTDNELMKKLAVGGMAEVEQGRLATQRAQNREVKEFGEHMVNDHSKANEKLKNIAKKQNVELPTRVDTEHASQKAMLEKHNGSKFDQEYISAQVAAHEKTAALLQNQISNGRDQELKQYAQETLPTVRSHLEKARQLQAKVGNSSWNSSSTSSSPRSDSSRSDSSRTDGSRSDTDRSDTDRSNSASRDRDDSTTTR